MSGEPKVRTCTSFESGLGTLAMQSAANPPPGNLDGMIAATRLHFGFQIGFKELISMQGGFMLGLLNELI